MSTLTDRRLVGGDSKRQAQPVSQFRTVRSGFPARIGRILLGAAVVLASVAAVIGLKSLIVLSKYTFVF